MAFRFAFLENSARALVNSVGSVQGTPKFTIKKLRPAWYSSTSRSVSLSDKFVFTHGFINITLSIALSISI